MGSQRMEVESMDKGKGKLNGKGKNTWQSVNVNRMAMNFKRKRGRKNSEILGRKGEYSDLGSALTNFKEDTCIIAATLTDKAEKSLGSKKKPGEMEFLNLKPPDAAGSSLGNVDIQGDLEISGRSDAVDGLFVISQ